jgi:hypothetical protein
LKKCQVCGNTESVYDGISDGGLRFVRYPEPICSICSVKLGVVDIIKRLFLNETPNYREQDFDCCWNCSHSWYHSRPFLDCGRRFLPMGEIDTQKKWEAAMEAMVMWNGICDRYERQSKEDGEDDS